MKVLVVCQHFYPEEFRINDICYELVKRGHDVTVLTGLPNYPKGRVLKEYKFFKNRKQTINGVKIIRVPLIGRGKTIIGLGINYLSFLISSVFKACFIKEKYDIVYSYQLSPITMVCPAIVIKKKQHIPLIIHCLDQWPISVTTGKLKNKNSLIYKILTKISIRIYNSADCITISSKSFKDYFEKVLKISSKEKGLIYHPSYAENVYGNIKQENNKVFDLLFAGNIGPAQSVETIVEAANILKENKNIFFHIVGDGLNKDKCEKLSQKYKLNNIKFYGFYPVNKLEKFYNIADAFLITMVDNEVVNNTLPAKIQGYMMAGKPIIGAINGEVKNVVKEAKCGLCCSSLDYKKLSEIILKAYKSNNLKKWGENAKKYYENNYRKEICMKNLEDLLEKCINENNEKEE